jgi:folate-dependent phosphoribosylglycinamide formyltransferase PurN
VCITSSQAINAYGAALAEALRVECRVVPDFLVAESLQRYCSPKWWELKVNMKWREFFFGISRIPGSTDFAELRKYRERARYPFLCNSLVEFAGEHGSRLRRVQTINSPAALRFLAESKFDLILNAGGGIFSARFIESAGAPILNAHMGNLPHFRGMNVLEWGILANRSPVVSIHRIVRGIDLGEIYSRVKVRLEEGDTLPRLRGRAIAANVPEMVHVVKMFQQGLVHGEEQQPDAGRQHYVMHAELRFLVEKKIAAGRAILIEDGSVPRCFPAEVV